MNELEPKVRLKIEDIVDKMQKLECTLLGNRDDAWVIELLFKPGFHRYHLIEWMLSKLEYDIGKMSGPQNSAEERMKNLQSTISDLGICRKNSHDVIKGTASVNEQLMFWCQLVDIIWLKHEIIGNNSIVESDEGVALSPEKSKTKSIHEEFEEASSHVSRICESVNLKHLFKTDMQLIAPDVQREIKNLSPSKTVKIPSLEEFKEAVKEKPAVNLVDIYKTLSHISLDEKENDFSEAELNHVEDELNSVSADLKSIAESSFNDVYTDLKPLIQHTKAEEFNDVGPAFNKLEPTLECLLQLKNSLLQLKSSYSKISKIDSDLDDLINQDTLADPSYIDILKLAIDEN